MSHVADSHIPVLFGELLSALHFFPCGQNIIVDCTLGLASHAIGVIKKLGKGDIFIGLDCDKNNLKIASENILTVLRDIPSENQPTIYCIHSNFCHIEKVLSVLHTFLPINRKPTKKKVTSPTAIYADLGVSSVHLDTAERGFSFRFNGPLDMRLDTTSAITAAHLVNTLPFAKLAETIRIYGDEPRAGFISKKIIEARELHPIQTTNELAAIVKKAWKDAVPKVFQALRITVNDELEVLKKLLISANTLLTKNGRVAIISFHSGEDRIVKQFFRDASQGSINPITGHEDLPGSLMIINKKPITPSTSEIESNPRSRSGLLRIAEKR